jgi:hypothetical protein
MVIAIVHGGTPGSRRSIGVEPLSASRRRRYALKAAWDSWNVFEMI